MLAKVSNLMGKAFVVLFLCFCAFLATKVIVAGTTRNTGPNVLELKEAPTLTGPCYVSDVKVAALLAGIEWTTAFFTNETSDYSRAFGGLEKVDVVDSMQLCPEERIQSHILDLRFVSRWLRQFARGLEKPVVSDLMTLTRMEVKLIHDLQDIRVYNSSETSMRSMAMVTSFGGQVEQLEKAMDSVLMMLSGAHRPTLATTTSTTPKPLTSTTTENPISEKDLLDPLRTDSELNDLAHTYPELMSSTLPRLIVQRFTQEDSVPLLPGLLNTNSSGVPSVFKYRKAYAFISQLPTVELRITGFSTYYNEIRSSPDRLSIQDHLLPLAREIVKLQKMADAIKDISEFLKSKATKLNEDLASLALIGTGSNCFISNVAYNRSIIFGSSADHTYYTWLANTSSEHYPRSIEALVDGNNTVVYRIKSSMSGRLMYTSRSGVQHFFRRHVKLLSEERVETDWDVLSNWKLIADGDAFLIKNEFYEYMFADLDGIYKGYLPVYIARNDDPWGVVSYAKDADRWRFVCYATTMTTAPSTAAPITTTEAPMSLSTFKKLPTWKQISLAADYSDLMASALEHTIYRDFVTPGFVQVKAALNFSNQLPSLELRILGYSEVYHILLNDTSSYQVTLADYLKIAENVATALASPDLWKVSAAVKVKVEFLKEKFGALMLIGYSGECVIYNVAYNRSLSYCQRNGYMYLSDSSSAKLRRDVISEVIQNDLVFRIEPTTNYRQMHIKSNRVRDSQKRYVLMEEVDQTDSLAWKHWKLVLADQRLNTFYIKNAEHDEYMFADRAVLVSGHRRVYVARHDYPGTVSYATSADLWRFDCS